jgi:hypothetical protein
MDLDRPITYRGIDFNHVDVLAGESKRSGYIVEEVNYGSVAGVGYTEKRAQGDGNDASDVYLSARRIEMRGYVYGESKADGFDKLQDLRSAFTPTAAYLESPSERGYLPLEFDIPTLDLTNFPSGYKLMQLFARPRAQPEFTIKRDSGSQSHGTRKGNAIAWSASLECKDPRIYLRDPTGLPYTGVEYFTTGETGVLRNRGDYPAPLDVLLDVAAGASGTCTCRFEVGGGDMTITIPASSNAQLIRYSSVLKVLTVEVNSVEVLRMDLMKVEVGSTHLFVPPSPPDAPYHISRVGSYTLGSQTRMMYNEAFA